MQDDTGPTSPSAEQRLARAISEYLRARARLLASADARGAGPLTFPRVRILVR